MTIKFVSALMAKFGMELLALLENLAAVANNGMTQLSNATALLISIGMAKHVYIV
jgi:hypothetical protein